MRITLVRQRLLTLPKKHSFFLLGARNTGKSTLITSQFPAKHSFLIDLLDAEQEAFYQFHPADLYRIVMSLPDHVTHIVIDEIQKAPKLLDSVQRLMKHKKHYFILTGSSARKLKRGGANLLAGRAFVYYLFPFSFLEVEDVFSLNEALRWGTLPEIFALNDDAEKQAFLSGYAHTYLKEEIVMEQLVRQLQPFRKFLEVAAQTNGQIVNYANIANDVKADEKTVKTYFEILEETQVGFFLEPFHYSVRKRQSEKPKFYFFDTGVKRALARELSVSLTPGNNAYGLAFEHYIMTEVFRLGRYFQPEYRFSHIRTPAGVEVDLVVERPGKKTVLIEIKSTQQVTSSMLTPLINIAKDLPKSEALCLSNDPHLKEIDGVMIYPWRLGLQHIFQIKN